MDNMPRRYCGLKMTSLISHLFGKEKGRDTRLKIREIEESQSHKPSNDRAGPAKWKALGISVLK